MESKDFGVPPGDLASADAVAVERDPASAIERAAAALATRVIPAAVIFADHESHVADLRKRAAAEIAPLLDALLRASGRMLGLADGMAEAPFERVIPIAIQSLREYGADARSDLFGLLERVVTTPAPQPEPASDTSDPQ